ncbi:flagellar basal body rod protein FlgB [Afipia sp. P52-10]|uniref:flagellar basal body rod protein FlgB n=1 Tax=Afipia sp. P52-10 TaxID=1429916 RepID=UPI0003DF039D|nr:flagellar basal body rod protein FlgB [Afipia sp. P52-10]ETR75818.1 flagellar basal body rod protein FlgB [Afipia sp. P52-10]
MAISDIPALSALRTSMQWHQQRQRILAENVANADTPNFTPRDLVRPSAQALAAGAAAPAVQLARTNPGHMTVSNDTSNFAFDRKAAFETRPSGNAVNLDDEMMKAASNQMDYQAVTSLYTRGLGLLKTAIGKR